MVRVTISDVARAAGVSAKSVSRVINREPNVSDKLRARVQDVVDRLGYVPEPAARSLAGGRTFAIGILFDNPSPHYTMKIQQGAYAACREHGFHLLVENLDTMAGDLADQMAAALHNTRVDGFILTPPVTDCDPVLEILEQNAIPYVRIAPVSHPGRSPALRIDDAGAARELAAHLWDLGHRRFALVGGPGDHGAAQTRRSGFLAELAARGNTAPVPECSGGFRFDGGRIAGLELLGLAEPPTAIFAVNDDSAAGVMAAAAQLGWRVPADLAVVGFDDSWVAQSVWPNLTTVHQPVTTMAYRAASWLIARRGASQAMQTDELPYQLVIRGSSQP